MRETPFRRCASVAGLLHFDGRDVPSCARHGLSARKIWLYFKALILSWAIWDFFIYLGFIAAGEDMGARWDLSALLPLPGGLFWTSWLAITFLAAACLLILYILMRASLKVSRLTFEQLRGDGFYSGSDASRFASSHSSPLITVPLLLLAVMLLGLLAGLLFGLVSRIPAAGPVITALLAIPLWGIMLLVVLAAIAFFLSFSLLPPIIASTGGDSFESVFELFSTMTSQPWRILLYGFLSLLSIVLGGAVFLFFSSSAAGLLAWTTGVGAGSGGFGAAITAGPQMLAPEVLPYFSFLVTTPVCAGGSAWTGLAGVLAGISGASIFLILLSYLLSSCSSAWTIIYLALRRRKDGVDLLEESDREDMREYKRLSEDDGTRSSADGQAESREG